MKKLLLIASSLLLIIVLSGCLPLSPAGQAPSYSSPTTQCYVLEPSVSFAFNGKIYIRIRNQVSIVKGKTGEFQNAGDLGDGRKVYFLATNYRGDSLADFLFILLGDNPKDKSAYLWDVYIDKARENGLPEFLTNCKETGALIPMVEGPDAPYFPPQVIKYEDIQNNQLVCVFADSVCAKFYVRIQEVDQLPDGNEKIGYLIKTVLDETHSYFVYHHNGVLYLEDQDSGKFHLYNPSEIEPVSNAKERNPSLQLATLRFMTTTQWTWATPSCKPVIYLYPQEPINLNVKIKPFGQLTVTDPPYDSEKGWEVLVLPDGTIQETHLAGPRKAGTSEVEKYPYLYYEGIITKFKTPNKGWVVKKEKLPEFFDDLLPQLGLNEKEARDFQDYWLGELIDSPYFFASLLSQKEIEKIEPVEFSKQPDIFIRVRFYFKDLDLPVIADPPVLPVAPNRNGFAAVEWGGLYQKP